MPHMHGLGPTRRLSGFQAGSGLLVGDQHSLAGGPADQIRVQNLNPR